MSIAPEHKDHGFQGPTNGAIASTYGELYQIVTHPAFRLGFLDAQNNRPFNHDQIMARIFAETPNGAMKRMGLNGKLWTALEIELAQYRYEEGRLAVFKENLHCKAWGHPDFPPTKVREYIWNRCDKIPREVTTELATSAVATLRGDGLPLFRRPAA